MFFMGINLIVTSRIEFIKNNCFLLYGQLLIGTFFFPINGILVQQSNIVYKVLRSQKKKIISIFLMTASYKVKQVNLLGFIKNKSVKN